MEKVNYRVQWFVIISSKGFSRSTFVHLFPEAVLMMLIQRFFSQFLTCIPDGGREFPFSFMLTVSSFRDIQPPMIREHLTYTLNLTS